MAALTASGFISDIAPCAKLYNSARHLRKMANIARSPPLYPRIAVRALPSGVLGPVDLSHGLQRLIALACRARLSSVQPLVIARLQ